MKRLLYIVIAFTLLAGLLGCTAPKATGQIVMSNKARDRAVTVTTGTRGEVVDGNSAFALDLYRLLAEKEGNVFLSPYSISQALAMTYAGARGQTEADMAKALRFTVGQDRLHPAFNWLDLELAKRGKAVKGKDAEGFVLRVVNAIWGQKDYQFLSPFLDTLAVNYGAGLRVVDFIRETEKSRVTINGWVEEQTERRIKDLIPQGAVNSLTRLVLTNAIYFKAAWQHQFKKEMTTNAAFYRLDGGSVNVAMMRQTDSFRYAQSDRYQAVELLYEGGEMSMVILLPREGQFTAFEKALDTETLTAILNALERQQVELTMPKFQYESSFSLKDALTAMGMGVAFTDEADFSGMNGKRDLSIADVLHKAFVAVDEEGTEAAAATAVIIGVTSLPPEPVEMKINRPFIYLIRDNATGTLIFVGRVMDPTAK